MTNIAKQIREDLRQFGITNRQVSVKADDQGASLRIKDFYVCYDLIVNVAKKFERKHLAQNQGEIVSPGSSYVTVAYDREAEKAIKSSPAWKDLLKYVTKKLEQIPQDSDEGIEVVPGFKAFRDNNGWKVQLKGSDKSWIYFYNIESLTFELFIQQNQGNLDLVQ